MRVQAEIPDSGRNPPIVDEEWRAPDNGHKNKLHKTSLIRPPIEPRGQRLSFGVPPAQAGSRQTSTHAHDIRDNRTIGVAACSVTRHSVSINSRKTINLRCACNCSISAAASVYFFSFYSCIVEFIGS